MAEVKRAKTKEQRARQAERQRHRRADRRATGLCVECSESAVMGKVYCAKHAAADNARTHARQKGLVEAGQCRQCGAPAVAGKTYCGEHLAAHSAQTRTRKKKRVEAGQCAQCGAPAVDGKTRCAEHQAAHNARRRTLTKKRAEVRTLAALGKPVAEEARQVIEAAKVIVRARIADAAAASVDRHMIRRLIDALSRNAPASEIQPLRDALPEVYRQQNVKAESSTRAPQDGQGDIPAVCRETLEAAGFEWMPASAGRRANLSPDGGGFRRRAGRVPSSRARRRGRGRLRLPVSPGGRRQRRRCAPGRSPSPPR